jgi:hypothetical protein
MSSETHGRFKRWFWRPPRPSGEVIADRQVSFLELFYDLRTVVRDVVHKADSPRELEGAPVGVLRGTRFVSPLSDPGLQQHRGNHNDVVPDGLEVRRISAVMVATVEISPAWTAPWARTRLLGATPQWSPAVP